MVGRPAAKTLQPSGPACCPASTSLFSVENWIHLVQTISKLFHYNICPAFRTVFYHNCRVCPKKILKGLGDDRQHPFTLFVKAIQVHFPNFAIFGTGFAGPTVARLCIITCYKLLAVSARPPRPRPLSCCCI